MAAGMVHEVTWRINRATKQAEIVKGDEVLETVAISAAAQRVAYHRKNEAKASGVQAVAADPMKRRRAA
jgi:hypothetical protein